MNEFKHRLLMVARALRESPDPFGFDMEREFNRCGTPACAWGHYVTRTDLQDFYVKHVVEGYAYSADGKQHTSASPETIAHFGITNRECSELFSVSGCNGATSPIEAAEYIEGFAERKYPSQTAEDFITALKASLAPVAGEREAVTLE